MTMRLVNEETVVAGGVTTHWVKRCWTRWHSKHEMKFKDFSTIKWHLLSIFFARSVAIVVNIIFVAVVSDLVNTESHLQKKRGPFASEV